MDCVRCIDIALMSLCQRVIGANLTTGNTVTRFKVTADTVFYYTAYICFKECNLNFLIT